MSLTSAAIFTSGYLIGTLSALAFNEYRLSDYRRKLGYAISEISYQQYWGLADQLIDLSYRCTCGAASKVWDERAEAIKQREATDDSAKLVKLENEIYK